MTEKDVDGEISEDVGEVKESHPKGGILNIMTSCNK